jgi:hypothetical protein
MAWHSIRKCTFRKTRSGLRATGSDLNGRGNSAAKQSAEQAEEFADQVREDGPQSREDACRTESALGNLWNRERRRPQQACGLMARAVAVCSGTAVAALSGGTKVKAGPQVASGRRASKPAVATRRADIRRSFWRAQLGWLWRVNPAQTPGQISRVDFSASCGLVEGGILRLGRIAAIRACVDVYASFHGSGALRRCN